MPRIMVTMLCAAVLLASSSGALAAETVSLWYPPAWKDKADQAKSIAEALAAKSGYTVNPRIASSYPQILAAFDTADYSLVYVGSFVQAVINARGLGTPLAQAVNGKEMYSGIMVYPKGQDPKAILKESPDQVAYTVGASSGESSAKAATGGKASLGVANHKAACMAVVAGKARAAVVKNWWWEGSKGDFAGLETYLVPGISEQKNPDNVLTASKSMPKQMQDKLREAAIASSDAFGAEMKAFDAATLQFSLDLMKKGGIDPLTYTW